MVGEDRLTAIFFLDLWDDTEELLIIEEDELCFWSVGRPPVLEDDDGGGGEGDDDRAASELSLAKNCRACGGGTNSELPLLVRDDDAVVPADFILMAEALRIIDMDPLVVTKVMLP